MSITSRPSTTVTDTRKGNRCLREVAAAVRGAARRRPLDIVARYGGEEIIAILVGSGRVDAAGAAEEVRSAVAQLGIAHSASSTRPYVTVSVGVTTVEPGGDYCHERAVRLADVALYAAKARGRDGWSFQGTAEGATAAVARQPAEAGQDRNEPPPLDERQPDDLLKTAS
jgi:predicted signal transduction protein with EAL and GGDEF domain